MSGSNDISRRDDDMGDIECATLVYVTAVHVEVGVEAGTVTAVFVDDDSVILLDERKILDAHERAALAIAERQSWPQWQIGL